MEKNSSVVAPPERPAYTGNVFKDFAVILMSLAKWALFLVVTFFCALSASILAIFRLANAAHVVAQIWGRTLLFCSGVKLRVHDAEKLYRDGPVIIMANHQSLFDVLVMYGALPIQFRWMAKASIFKIPLFGSAMAGAGYIPVERDDKKKALQALFVAAEAVQAGKSVIIYPEGTRGYPDGRMRSFKKGGLILARKANVVIQPLTIDGARRILPIQEKHILQRMYGGAIDVYVHDPIMPEAQKGLSLDGLSDMLREVIARPLPDGAAGRQNETSTAGESQPALKS